MLTFLQEILVLHLKDIPTGLVSQSKDGVGEKEIPKVQRPEKVLQYSLSDLKPKTL